MKTQTTTVGCSPLGLIIISIILGIIVLCFSSIPVDADVSWTVIPPTKTRGIPSSTPEPSITPTEEIPTTTPESTLTSTAVNHTVTPQNPPKEKRTPLPDVTALPKTGQGEIVQLKKEFRFNMGLLSILIIIALAFGLIRRRIK